METSRWSEKERSIWKMLPLHPQPQWLESLSSYIIRLAEANGLKAMNELATLSGIRGWETVRHAPDYSSYSVRRLAYLAGCTPTILQNMTFYHLAHHFNRSSLLFRDMRDFFQGCIAPWMRYCPLCLAEIPYYHLCWRFLAIEGCYKHKCYLLSTCGHCDTPISFLPPIPRLTFCATCQGDLKTCPTSLLAQHAETRLQRYTRDLELLLMPTEWAPEITQALSQGSGFTFLRQRKHLSMTEVAHVMEKDEQVVREIEEGKWSGKATLADYWHYIELLDSSLVEVLEAAQIMRSSEYGKRQSKLEQLALLVKMEDLSRSRAEQLQKESDVTRPRRKGNKSNSSKS